MGWSASARSHRRASGTRGADEHGEANDEDPKPSPEGQAPGARHTGANTPPRALARGSRRGDSPRIHKRYKARIPRERAALQARARARRAVCHHTPRARTRVRARLLATPWPPCAPGRGAAKLNQNSLTHSQSMTAGARIPRERTALQARARARRAVCRHAPRAHAHLRTTVVAAVRPGAWGAAEQSQKHSLEQTYRPRKQTEPLHRRNGN